MIMKHCQEGSSRSSCGAVGRRTAMPHHHLPAQPPRSKVLRSHVRLCQSRDG